MGGFQFPKSAILLGMDGVAFLLMVKKGKEYDSFIELIDQKYTGLGMRYI